MKIWNIILTSPTFNDMMQHKWIQIGLLKFANTTLIEYFCAVSESILISKHHA